MRALSSRNTQSNIVLRNEIDKIRLLFRKDRESYLCFYRILGFYPRNIQLYEQALLHKSTSVRSDKGRPLNNERLEFLGDAILDAIVGDIVYKRFEGKREGFLTNTRSKIVQRETLNKLAVEIGLDKLIKYSTRSSSHKPSLILQNIHEIGLDCVVCIGGNGTQKTAAKFVAMGVNIVSVPKTIDNDIWGTDISFGFDSAVSIATDAIDRLHSTASSHKRVMVIEVMGHKAGWIALYSGMAGGGDVILVPEIAYNIKNIGNTILERLKKGKPYSIVVVAEGIQTDGRKRAAEYIAQEIEYETGIETRETVLGYIQRGGSPTPFDRNLSTRMGGHATELIANGQFGRMVTLKGDDIASIPLEEVAGKLKLVTEDHDLVIQGRRMGICFG
jgi:ATP-dependent phosphofructokinase / diphosphate-dependent phosphofructokinase